MGWTFLCCISQPERSSKKKLSPSTSVDLSRMNLMDIPLEEIPDPGTLQNLDVSYNKLDDLNPVLIRCTHLKTLNLSDNLLKNLPDALGTAIRNLIDLNLSHNQFDIIPPVISSFQHLKCLDLSNNPIQKILDGSITELVNLKELRLNSCAINFLPANIGRLVNLEILELRENYLESLPPTIKLLHRLRLLDMGRNNFEELSAELGQLMNLDELIVDENNLCDISTVGDLMNLRHLDISNNRLDIFQEEITNCTCLEIVDGDGNEFEILPDSIGRLVNLKRLNLNFVGLKFLPASIGMLQELEELKVQENYIQHLPGTIGLLRRLRILVIHENCLVDLPDELASCVSLTHLNVANNQLTRLPDNIGHLKQMKSMNLMGNFLMYLPLSIGMIDTQLWLSPYQTGMQKPKLTQVEYVDVGIVLTSPLLEQNYQPTAQKSIRNQNKIQFNVKTTSDEDGTSRDTHDGKSGKDHFPHMTRMPTPTQKERRKLEKCARTINEHQRKSDVPRESIEIKEARVTPTSSGYLNTPRQRRSIDPEYIELGNSSEFRPLTRPQEPPPYNFAKQYSKMSPIELENFQKMDSESTSLLMRNPSVQ